MLQANSLKHPQQFYLTLLSPQTVFILNANSPPPLTHLPCPDDASLFTQSQIYVLSFTNNQLMAIGG
ncbi:hypothetical protein E1803_00180 [Salmonella enterica subsp. enterica serovar Eastbourne]|nr:hypothetical protein [Salmonella enterica subsp. enterica serovar Eastbourne]